ENKEFQSEWEKMDLLVGEFINNITISNTESQNISLLIPIMISE
ncbi:3413_t:CDS:1, partial [Dentiscutata erythropus]